ncbi:hypothetical protein DXH78_09305 [Undibacter mobilis]|uniref:Uncharacterized protein n=2 Tax=Undibacter mobilis TaxID=2292256 RepID=A0A371BBL4_9BRAD|nr:hypothetical protein DXH78_09305 [Undibacter mobilis]
MGRAISAISGSAAGFLHRPVVSLGHSAARFWRDLSRLMFHPYRPERHYMRGPGPACAKKRGQTQN